MQDRAGASEDYRKSLESDPNHRQARQRLAECHLSATEGREAAEQFTHLLQDDPDNSDLKLGLARALRLQGKAEEACRLLDEVLGRREYPVEALVARGALARDTGHYDEGGKWYRQALARDPNDRDSCSGLALCLQQQGHTEEAARYRDRASRIERDLEQLRDLHARIGRAPEDVELRYQVAQICLRNGQNSEARRWLTSPLRLQPEHQPSLELLRRCEK